MKDPELAQKIPPNPRNAAHGKLRHPPDCCILLHRRKAYTYQDDAKRDETGPILHIHLRVPLSTAMPNSCQELMAALIRALHILQHMGSRAGAQPPCFHSTPPLWRHFPAHAQ